MQSDMLRKAREYERENRPSAEKFLPVFHLTGGIGWINDPNGFSAYRGEYHLFFQYYPYDVQWGAMHWGHAKTRDFIRWEMLPAAMAPDTEWDRDGCFSGSAIELGSGEQRLLYTGVRKERLPDGSVRELQLQCAATGDGRDYEKSPLNPVIGISDLPEGGSSRDFRDPKLWRDEEGYHAVVADRAPDGTGAILLYDSDDALRWHYVGVLAEGAGRYGGMWECPDFFLLDGKAVLLHSAHDMRTAAPEFHPGNGTVCQIGQYDRTRRRLLDERVQTIDSGLDFYAPQTLETADGRRVLIGWMQSWERSRFNPPGLPFFGQMTVPRELRVVNGRLLQQPVRELESCRRNPVSFRNTAVGEETRLPGVSGRSADMILHIRPGQGGCRRFCIRVAEGDGFYTEITLLPEEGILRMDRLHSGVCHDVVHVRDIPAPMRDGELDLRLVLDKYSLELFAGEGERAASMTLYTPQSADGISFRADGAAVLDGEKYDIAADP